MKKINVNNLLIEVTRRCNMDCNHCLRGEPEKMDVCTYDTRALLEQCEHINSIVFTGGEPSLNSEAIETVLEQCKSLGVSVGSFYIATNGKAITEHFVLTCLRWYAYCDDNEEMTSVYVSNDGHHQEQGSYNTELLDGLSFFKRKQPEEGQYYESFISEGRYEGHFQARPFVASDFELDSGNLEGEVYLNCEGNIIIGCDWSYESQRKPENILCEAGDSILDAVTERGWNNDDDE